VVGQRVKQAVPALSCFFFFWVCLFLSKFDTGKPSLIIFLYSWGGGEGGSKRWKFLYCVVKFAGGDIFCLF
jgi:hypothetical protein